MFERPIFVAGMSFGDEGKGMAIATFARHVSFRNLPTLTVRYNGGAQAAHNVINGKGRHHTFAQITSNMMVPGASGLLSSFMLFNPWNYMVERERFIGSTGIVPQMFVDAHAPMITPYHVIANRIAALANGGGSTCGQGIGELAADIMAFERQKGPEPLRAKDCYGENPDKLAAKLGEWQYHKLVQLQARFGTELDELGFAEQMLFLTDPTHPRRSAEALDVSRLPELCFEDELLEDTLNGPGAVLFEGAQGVLLDEYVGFHPYTTWSDTTFNNAYQLLAEVGFREDPFRVGVFRTYTSRHGDGPLPGDSGGTYKEDVHNGTTFYQGAFRNSAFDTPLAYYAMSVCPIDAVFVTHADILRDSFPEIVEYSPAPSWTQRQVSFDTRHQARKDPALEAQLLAEASANTEMLSHVVPKISSATLPAYNPVYSSAQMVASRVARPLAGYSKSPCFEDSVIWRTD